MGGSGKKRDFEDKTRRLEVARGLEVRVLCAPATRGRRGYRGTPPWLAKLDCLPAARKAWRALLLFQNGAGAVFVFILADIGVRMHDNCCNERRTAHQQAWYWCCLCVA